MNKLQVTKDTLNQIKLWIEPRLEELKDKANEYDDAAQFDAAEVCDAEVEELDVMIVNINNSLKEIEQFEEKPF